tara:strand:- start:383 stop:754 length:372 start_codon:yes stop_codon:yes gene_type:complete
MKYIKSVDIKMGKCEGTFQKGQTGKDEFNNLYVFQGIGKDGSNVWLNTMSFNSITGKYKERFCRKTGKAKQGLVNDMRRARAALRKVQKLESSFNNKILKDVRPSFYEVNQKSKQFLDPSKLA